MLQQRDAFIKELDDLADSDEDIVFLSADFGAPALDDFRKKYPDRFFHLGISEQNMIDVAIGLAERNKKVFTYAMAPFISLRCSEQHKIAAMMNLPITNIIAGVGLSYANAGPTHYATEDLATFASMAGASIYTCSDSEVTRQLAQKLVERPEFSFVRLDRECGGEIVSNSNVDLAHGYRSFFQGSRIALLSNGYSLRRLYDKISPRIDLHDKIRLFDLIRFKPLSEELINELQGCDYLISVDEQMPFSALGTLLAQEFNEKLPGSKKLSYTLDDKYLFENSGRHTLNEMNGIKMSAIIEKIDSFL